MPIFFLLHTLCAHSFYSMSVSLWQIQINNWHQLTLITTTKLSVSVAPCHHTPRLFQASACIWEVQCLCTPMRDPIGRYGSCWYGLGLAGWEGWVVTCLQLETDIWKLSSWQNIMFLSLVLEAPKGLLPALKERRSLAETTVCWSLTNMACSYTHSTHRLTQTINNLAPFP